MREKPTMRDRGQRHRQPKWTANLPMPTRSQDQVINRTVPDPRYHPLATKRQTDTLKDSMANLKVAWFIPKEMDRWATTPITPTRLMVNRARFTSSVNTSTQAACIETLDSY